MKRIVLCTLLVLAWLPLMAQMKYFVSTNSLVYDYGDSIHVTVSAKNIGKVLDTLWLSDCDVEYSIDSFKIFGHFGHGPCPLTQAPYVVSPGDSLEWTYVPPFPVTKDSLPLGRHSVVGEISGYGISDTLWVSVNNLSAVVLVSPKGLTGGNRIPVFVWNSVPNATSYHGQVSYSSSMSPIIAEWYVVDTSVISTDTLFASTRYYWQVAAVNAGGQGPYSGVSSFLTAYLGVSLTSSEVPKVFALMQNYPNPFNPSTIISYQLPTSSVVSLKVLDVLGREIATLVNDRQNPGNHSVRFSASNLSSGVYYYRLQAGTYIETKKLTVIK